MYRFYLNYFFFIYFLLCIAKIYSLDVLITLREKDSLKPISIATVLVKEAKKKIFSSDDGIIKIDLKKGRYTLRIRGLGFQEITKKIIVTKEKTVFSFELDFLKTQGGEISIIAGKAKQTLGRNSLSKKNIKDTPGSLGDALGAVTSLPGIIRSGSFWGELLLRGAPTEGNRYLVDGIPLLYPQHFGGLQFIVSNEIIKTLDVYLSNAPLDFGQTYGGVISVDTKDKVKDFSGYSDISLLYSSVYFEGPFIEKDFSKNSTDRQFGFWIASGRIGYLGLTVLPLVRLVTGNSNIPLPQYYDYQFKFVFWLDKDAKHEIRTLLIGSGDILDLGFEISGEEQQDALDEGADPLLVSGTNFSTNQFNNAINFIYQYNAFDWLINQLKIYTTINYTNVSINSAVINEAVGDVGVDTFSFPNVTAFEDLLNVLLVFGKFNLDLSSLIGYRLYTFFTRGQNIVRTSPSRTSNAPPDFVSEEIRSVELDFRGYNHTIYGFLKAKFKVHGFFGEFGSRIEYLDRTADVVFDPRAIIGYSSSTGTTISAATGLYHSFPQVNFFYFNGALSNSLQVPIDDVVNAERSWQSSGGIEQKFLGLYSVKIEGFYNDIPNRITINDEEGDLYINRIQHRVYGFEFLLRKDLREGQNDFYGWLSYTYSVSREKKNLITDPSGDQFTPFNSDITHALKLVAGYKFKRHEIGIRFELFTGSPYTPIVGSNCPAPSYDLNGGCVINIDGEPVTRYSPVYGNSNAERFPLSHRLDLRYTYTKKYSWGIFRFYVDLINAYYYLSPSQQSFKYNEPFNAGSNPVIQAPDQGIPIIPSFGFEFSF